jgi:Spy/CpxP family protein refolding chaperone
MPSFLNLTAAQEKSVKAIRERHMTVQVGRHRALDAKEAALREGLEDPGLSDAQLRALLAAESEAKLQAVLEERAVFLETYAVLSPEQQAMALRLRQKLQKEREAHREVMDELRGPEGLGPGL